MATRDSYLLIMTAKYDNKNKKWESRQQINTGWRQGRQGLGVDSPPDKGGGALSPAKLFVKYTFRRYRAG